MSEYIPEKYITVNDVLDHFGWTKEQINTIDEVTRNRYANWVREGNNLVETTLFDLTESGVPLSNTSKEYTYAKSAALNWVVYKRRDKEGSKNAPNAKNDHKDDLEMIRKLLTATRTDRTKTTSIAGQSFTRQNILLPSQIDTKLYNTN